MSPVKSMKFFFSPSGSEGAQGSYFIFPQVSFTFLKAVALSHFLNGWKLASLIKTEISEPENLVFI